MEANQTGTITWRPAATVILAREKGGELQVYLLRRSPKSSFFPGRYVFPGGAVEPEDHIKGPWEAHADLSRDEILRKFGGGLAFNEAFAYGVSAIRETFEEAGVFLGNQKYQVGMPLKGLCDRRLTVGLLKGWFWEWVVSGEWILAYSRIARWSHWITPELMRKHYDTRFYLAFMPAGQACAPDTRETTHGIWTHIETALAGNLQGTVPLSPPTLVTLHELLKYNRFRDLEKEVETRTWGEKRFPRLVPLSQGAILLQPWDPMRHEALEIDPKKLEKAILPVGEPFSRLWLHQGIWKPVSVQE